MSLHVIECHERADGTEISVGRDRHGEYLVVLDALGGLEATIRFVLRGPDYNEWLSAKRPVDVEAHR